MHTNTITGTVRRFHQSIMSRCAGDTLLALDDDPHAQNIGHPVLDLDWLAGTTVPQGAHVRITVEVLDAGECPPPPNPWHQREARIRARADLPPRLGGCTCQTPEVVHGG